MKIRGAARKRKRTMYAFQRIGDVGQISAAALNLFATRYVETQIRINRWHTHQKLIEQGYYGPVTAEGLDRLGTSITKENHADD